MTKTQPDPILRVTEEDLAGSDIRLPLHEAAERFIERCVGPGTVAFFDAAQARGREDGFMAEYLRYEGSRRNGVAWREMK